MFGLTPFISDRDWFTPFRELDRDSHDFFSSAQRFRTDIRDAGDQYIVEAELPGFDKQDIQLDVTGNTLVLSAQRKATDDTQDAQGHYIRRERSYGVYRRAFDLNGIDSEHLEAVYQNGILKLTLPKQSRAECTTRRIEIQS